mgnify:CR=1 FL=1
MSKIVSTVIAPLWALNPVVIETDTNLERLQSRLVMATKGYVPHNKMMWGLAKIIHLNQGDAHWLKLIFADSDHGVRMHLERTTYGHYIVSSSDRSGVDELPELKAIQFGTQIIDGVQLCEEIIAALTDDDWEPPARQLLTRGDV